MTWDAAISALLAELQADAELIALLGGPHIYRSSEIRELRVPSVTYTIVSAPPTETTLSILTQWDVFAGSLDQLVAIERRLRRLLHWVGWRDVGGVSMSSVYVDSRDHRPPGPGRWHRSLDFRHEPVRSRGW
ncbi:MAG TPA: hypothetical protein VIL46_10355 [Gemmataceae bacterium]